MCDIVRTVPGVCGERMLGGGDKGASGDFAAGRTLQVSVKTLFETYVQLDEVAGFAELYQIEDATTERF